MSEGRIGRLGTGPNGHLPPVNPAELGPIARYLLSRLSDSGIEPQDAENLIRTALEIQNLVRVDNHRIVETSTTALIGKVQSGKTTGVALAMSVLADAGVDCFIVLTGTKKTLTEQTGTSLADMFGPFSDHQDWFWEFAHCNGRRDDTFNAMKNHWQVPSNSHHRFLLVVTIMKEDDYLDVLNDVLHDLIEDDIDLSGRFVVFDDEADQGSPDRAGRNAIEPSPLNRYIGNLRAQLGTHSFIPVTATPQALLLDQPDGFVRPDKAVLLAPGSKYVGGHVLFRDFLKSYVRHVPTTDLNALDSQSVEPPLSLLDALATFLLTAAVIRRCGNKPSPVSMLIHPHRERAFHVHVVDWLNQILPSWRTSIMESVDVSLEPCFRYFQRAAKDLVATDTENKIDQAGFSEVGEGLSEWIRFATSPIQTPLLGIRKVSGNDSFSFNEWKDRGIWILIGGDVLGRGFVVQGLATTYMTRDVRQGAQYNMDTLQQRARFFGYKQDYLSLLRGWFPSDLSEKFVEYVDHEEFLWRFLEQQMSTGKNLRESRTIFSHSQFGRPTRSSANRRRSRASDVRSGWFKQQYLFDRSLAANQEFLGRLRTNHGAPTRWNPPLFSHRDIDFDSWLVSSDVATEFLKNWRAISLDSAVIYVIEQHLKNLEDASSVRIVDMKSKQRAGRVSSIPGFRSLEGGQFDLYGADPWAHSEFARTINLHTGNPGHRDDECLDPNAVMTFQIYSIIPRINQSYNDPTADSVGAIAVHFADPVLRRVFGERDGA